jgi:GT2 family glycosyltransferase
MISTKNSNHYTWISLESFFKTTTLGVNDKFYLVDNDNEGIYNNLGVDVVSNTRPKSFAKNVNDAIARANGKDVVVLSNDVIFTPGWNIPLVHYSKVLLLPSCNQTHLYSSKDGLLNLKTSVTIDEYNDQFYSLVDIAQQHRKNIRPGFFEMLLMGFYVFKLPAEIYNKVGLFDEQFGVGGGEDIDYRIRVLQAGFTVKYHSQSYLLHFAGKSTWDGPEKTEETPERNKKYRMLFANKWGNDLAELCLTGGHPGPVIEKYSLQDLLRAQEFNKAINVVLNNTKRG